MKLGTHTVAVWNFSDEVVEQRYDGRMWKFKPGLVDENVVPWVASVFERLAGRKGVVAVDFRAAKTKADREDILRDRRIFALEKMISDIEERLHDAECVVHDHRGKPVHKRDDHRERFQARLEHLYGLLEKAPQPKKPIVTVSAVEGAEVPVEELSLSDLGTGAAHPGSQELAQLAG